MDSCDDSMMVVSSGHADVAPFLDVLGVMQVQESTMYRRNDYLRQPEFSRILDGAWRQRIVEWMYSVTDHCSLRRDSVAVAAHYLDLCVERGVVESRQQFQLAAMTALQLAIKLYDSTVVKLDSMIKLGRGLFKEQDVVDMEMKILNALKWQVHPPTPNCFIRQFLQLLPQSISPQVRFVLAEVTRFIAEISTCLYKFVSCRPSVIAYSAIVIAMERLDDCLLPMWQRQEILSLLERSTNSDHTSPEIQQTAEKLQTALGKNVSLQDLMATIDAQWRAEFLVSSYAILTPSTFTVEPSRCKKARQDSVCSPRDIVPACRYHSN
jgi:hypothetical protein